jgi:hypothetical protein
VINPLHYSSGTSLWKMQLNVEFIPQLITDTIVHNLLDSDRNKDGNGNQEQAGHKQRRTFAPWRAATASTCLQKRNEIQSNQKPKVWNSSNKVDKIYFPTIFFSLMPAKAKKVFDSLSSICLGSFLFS